MFEWLGNLEDVAGDLYPYRWAITAGAMAVAVALIALAVWLGAHRTVWRHRLITAAIAVPLLAVLLPVSWYVASPLWERSRLEEPSPLAASVPTVIPEAPAGEGVTVEDAFMARLVRRGMFEGADDFHFGRGDALLIETAPGVHTLRFEAFSVRNGPDLFVYLTNDRNDVSKAVNLGELKATDGNFNYDVPAGVDPAAYRYALVWCRQFATRFALATLEPA